SGRRPGAALPAPDRRGADRGRGEGLMALGPEAGWRPELLSWIVDGRGVDQLNDVGATRAEHARPKRRRGTTPRRSFEGRNFLPLHIPRWLESPLSAE